MNKPYLHYDSAQASSYDRDRELEHHWEAENAFIRAYFSSRKYGRLLDAPVGTGRFIPYYSNIGKVTGVDASSDMLKEAIARQQEHSVAAEILHGDIFALPFADNDFDVAVCWRFVHLIEPGRLAPALRELARVTNGEILLQTYTRGAFLSRFTSRLLRAPGRILGRLLRSGSSAPPWAHIQAYFHSSQILDRAIADAGLRVVGRRRLCKYQGHDVCVSVLTRQE